MEISLRAKLTVSFLGVIIICGLVATVVGVRLIGTAIINQAQDKVRHDLSTGWAVYREETENLRDVMRFTALRFFLKEAISDDDIEALKEQLEAIRRAESLDMLTLTDENGKVIARSRNPSVKGDSQASDELVSSVVSTREVIAG